MFRIGKDEELTKDVLLGYLQQHEEHVKKYERLKNQYITNPPILHKEDNEPWKPDDRIPVNFGRYIVDTFNGFFNGVPMKVSHKDDDVNAFIREFWRNNNMDNTLNELAKTTSIYGRGYLYVYQNEYAQTEVAYCEPFDMFVIYTDEIRPKSLYGVRYTKDESGVYKGQLFTADQEYEFMLTSSDLHITTPVDEFGNEVGGLYYGRIPIIEFIENEYRTSLIEPVEHQINTYNRVLSEKSNDVSYFSDAYLAILGAKLDDDSIKRLKEDRIIALDGRDSQNITIEFLEKPDADQTQENLLNRLEKLIFETSMVVNLNDDKAGNSTESSGVALARKEQPMANMASNKEHKFTQSLQTMFGMVFNVIGNVSPSLKDEYINIKFDWYRNLPANNADEANTVRTLDGIVSRRQQLEMLSVVEDVDEELARQTEGLIEVGDKQIGEPIEEKEEITEEELKHRLGIEKLEAVLNGNK